MAQKETTSFLLTNTHADVLSLTGTQNLTHYQGYLLFNLNTWDYYKILENISLETPPTSVENNHDQIKRKTGKTEETFTLLNEGIIYEVKNYTGQIALDLDCRSLSDTSDQGRIYNQYYHKKEKELHISYTKHTDNTLNQQHHTTHIIITALENYHPAEIWIPLNYPYDESRGDFSSTYIYRAGSIPCKKNAKLLITAGPTREKALAKNIYLKKQQKQLLQHHKERIKKQIPTNASNELKQAAESLNQLTPTIKETKGIFAGLPWFYQYWARDELISLKAHILLGNTTFAKQVIKRHLHNILKDGRLSNRFPPTNLGNADGIGWLFVRIHDLIQELEKTKKLHKEFTHQEIYTLQTKLEQTIRRLLLNHLGEKGLITNKLNETWIDTEIEEDRREGACIEIQALQLNLYLLLQKLSNITHHTTHLATNKLLSDLKNQVQTRFFHNKKLADRIHNDNNDTTQRPNIFLAYYIAPALFTKKEWETIFDTALKELWLPWGGLASISTKHRLFQKYHTGFNNLSYHRGDSWYWVNNITAICLYRCNKKKYKPYIDAIKKASIQEMNTQGFIGHCAEISSAEQRESKGCFAQAWSAATLIELLKEIE